MARPPAPLPPQLGQVFTTHDARAAGVDAERLRCRDLTLATRGVHARPEALTTLRDLARAHALVLPRPFAFSHDTAAHLLGLPLPRPWRPGDPLHVMRLTGTPLITRAGVRSHRGLERRGVETLAGLRVVERLDTWADLAGVLPPDDLLAVADHLVRLGEARVKDLVRLAEDRRTPGVGRLRACAPLARAGSASPWESKARWTFHEWGLPEPELNVDVLDASGHWLARPDFLWRERRVVGEYDGDQHRTDRSVWQYERERRARLEDAGHSYVEMTSLSLVSPRHREALRARLSRLLLG